MTATKTIINGEAIRHLQDDEPKTAQMATVSLKRWLAESNEWADLAVGVRITPADDLEQLIATLPKIALIAVDFASFIDGRAYSQVVLLRKKWHYKRHIRALNGHLDQLQSMWRCGVDAIELNAEYKSDDIEAYLSGYSICYQRAENNSGMIEKFKPN